VSAPATVLRAARPAARRAPTTSRAARPALLRPPARTRTTALRVVDSEARLRARRVRRVMWCLVALVVLALFAAVVFHVQLAQGQLELDRLERQTAVAREQYQQLRLEYAQQASPAAIQQRAEAMGMVRAGDVPTYVVVPDAPPPTKTPDQTSTTLQEGWEKVKPHLGTQP
jgi:cell division protein FtsL